MIAEKWSYIFRLRSRFCRRRVCLSSLLKPLDLFLVYYVEEREFQSSDAVTSIRCLWLIVALSRSEVLFQGNSI